MKRKNLKLIWPSIWLFFLFWRVPALAVNCRASQEKSLQPFFAKSRVTIAVTDSGLGGLGILAEAAARMEKAGIFKKVDFVFFNALFSNEGGYNTLPSTEAKVRIFNSALESLARTVRPDLILIGCNTLSVIYDQTDYAAKANIPVLGIVEAGTDLMAEALRRSPPAAVILFGTPTTVGEGAYQKKLLDLGFPGHRIVIQACPDLEAFIEKNPDSDETALLIAGYAAEALAKLPDLSAPFAVSLNCTHYGYSLKAFEAAFAEEKGRLIGILNPNSKMLDSLFPWDKLGRLGGSGTEVSVRVISMVEISAEKAEAIGRILEKTSPLAALALKNYKLEPGLFEWIFPQKQKSKSPEGRP